MVNPIVKYTNEGMRFFVDDDGKYRAIVSFIKYVNAGSTEIASYMSDGMSQVHEAAAALLKGLERQSTQDFLQSKYPELG